MTGRPLRSVHFVPAHRPEWVAPALREDPDVIVLDLEDAVPSALKGEARERVHTVLMDWPRQRRTRPFVRFDAVPGAADIALLHALTEMEATLGFVLPKYDGKVDPSLEGWMSAHDSESIALIESWSALRAFVARPPNRFLRAVALGTEDLLADPSSPPHAHPRLLDHAACSLAVTALSHGLRPLHGVYPDVADVSGFDARVQAARERGCFGGMSIHPSQIGRLNRAFSIDDAARSDAKYVISAALASGYDGGYVKTGDRLLTPPKVARARHLLALADEENTP